MTEAPFRRNGESSPLATMDAGVGKDLEHGEVPLTDVQPSATSLIERHRALGARLVDFAGWEMPVQYSGILEEHRAVRERTGLFDVSHMGELWVEGREAAAAKPSWRTGNRRASS